MDRPDTALDFDGVLAHFGVKGMKWGVRKSRPAVAVGTVRVTQKKPGGKLTSEGGKGIPAHEDAIRVRQHRQAAKGSGVHALSNKQLQEAVQRMNLEQQYSRLAPKSKPQKAAQFLSKVLLGAGQQQASKVVNDAASQQVGAMLNKKNNK